MTALLFDETELSRKIEQLSIKGRAAFAAACAERMLPSFAKFVTRTARGKPDALRDVLTRLWNDLVRDPMSDAEVDAQIAACMDLIPNENGGPWVQEQAAAEDAASALAYALRCRRSGLAKDAAWAARRCYEALDNYVINHEAIDTSIPGEEARVRSHPLVQAELGRQQRDLNELLCGEIAIISLWERSKAEAASFLP